jgi:DNA processing protein
MVELEEGQCRFLLANVCEPGDSRLNKLTEKYSWNELVQNNSLLPAIYQAKIATLDKSKLLEEFSNSNFIWPGHEFWPRNLNDLGLRTPIGLWYRGKIENMNPISISIVGSRSATDYGENVASDIAMKLCALNIDVVSGGAIGIDAAAHRGSLIGAGFTIAVLAGGVEVNYPKSNSLLFEKIAANGLILSEVPPRTAPIRHRFLIRNRLIAALSNATLVVEAKIKSGAMSTAGEAATIGRDVMAIPGSIHSGSSAGCHQLIRDGAVLVTDVKEICELIVGDYPQYSQ